MQYGVVHVDDEEEEPRKIAERLLYDGLPAFFDLDAIEDGQYYAADKGYGDTKISWKYRQSEYKIEYLKFRSEDEIPGINIKKYDRVLFIFDVHRPNDKGTGADSFLIQSVTAARALCNEREFNAVIWTHFPNAPAVREAGVETVLKKRNVEEFAVKIMELLGFSRDV